MQYSLTLISPPGKPLLQDAILPQLEAALNQRQTEVLRAKVLSENHCVRIEIAGEPHPNITDAVQAVIQQQPIDVALLPIPNERKRLLIADMDSTIIQCECLDELAAAAGFGAQVSSITERAMRGELNFEEALQERVAMLKGQSENLLLQTYKKKIQLTRGAKELVATMRAHGAFTALVSGGFTFFTSRVAAEAGFDVDFGNTLEIVDGVLTGQVIEPILGQSAKLTNLERLCAEKSIDLNDTLAVGDGANDLAMIQRAGVGVSFMGKPLVVKGADVAIKHTDLRSLLYIQGYTDAEIVSPTTER